MNPQAPTTMPGYSWTEDYNQRMNAALSQPNSPYTWANDQLVSNPNYTENQLPSYTGGTPSGFGGLGGPPVPQKTGGLGGLGGMPQQQSDPSAMMQQMMDKWGEMAGFNKPKEGIGSGQWGNFGGNTSPVYRPNEPTSQPRNGMGGPFGQNNPFAPTV